MRDEMEDFLTLLAGTDKSERTVQQYRTGLRQYSEWLDQEDLDVDNVSPRDIKLYLSYLKSEKEFAPKTIRLRFTAISQFYESEAANRDDLEDPTDDVKVSDYGPKTTRKEEITKQKHIWLSKDELRQLVENVPAPKLRNRLVVLFQFYTGLRRQEVSDVKIADLDRENRMVQVRGKNDKTHTAHWQPKLDGLLTAWLDGGVRDASPYAGESEYLFLSNTNAKLSGSQINVIVKEAAENAGIQEALYTDAAGKTHYKITSHTLRHSFAMLYIENGGSPEVLSKILAHDSLRTTQIYMEIQEDRAKDGYEQFAPDIEIDL